MLCLKHVNTNTRCIYIFNNYYESKQKAHSLTERLAEYFKIIEQILLLAACLLAAWAFTI